MVLQRSATTNILGGYSNVATIIQDIWLKSDRLLAPARLNLETKPWWTGSIVLT